MFEVLDAVVHIADTVQMMLDHTSSHDPYGSDLQHPASGHWHSQGLLGSIWARSDVKPLHFSTSMHSLLELLPTN